MVEEWHFKDSAMTRNNAGRHQVNIFCRVEMLRYVYSLVKHKIHEEIDRNHLLSQFSSDISTIEGEIR